MTMTPVHTTVPVDAPARAHDPEGRPSEVHGRCYRCGRPTVSPEVGLCEECNPSGIAGPTATQVHGLILGSVAAALLVLALGAKLLAPQAGPFPATVIGQSTLADGSVEVALQVTNQGRDSGRPTCTVTRGPDDVGVEFLAQRIDGGATVSLTKRLAPLPAGSPTAQVQVRCR